jgi:NAD(P)-dependent dehydrogenase (short-subunit alcohol dehydrogenase family)
MDLGLAGRVGIVAGTGGEVEEATARLLRAEGAELREPPVEGGEAGDVDFLVNFAGGGPERDLRAAYERRVIAPLRTMKAFAPALAARGEGRIVNVVPTAEPVTSAAALALSRLFSDRYGASGVLVNAVSAGPDADPEAVAREIAFLCSARASHVAGSAGVID